MIGLALAQVGPFADPTAIATVAEEADVRGALDLGAHQVLLDLVGATDTLGEQLDLADAITRLTGLRQTAGHR